MSARLIIVGGFLGAGKTSAILRLAETLVADGKKVGIVTNDQSENLVDTNFLRGEGKAVVEVTRGCFCCNFDEFTLKLNSLTESELPDVILAEPVGSCTDLIATIFKPIMNNYTRDFTLAPLSVLADPRRIRKFINACAGVSPTGVSPAGVSPAGDMNEINYLFDKQLSEADIILINKRDQLSDTELDELEEFLRKTYPGAEVAAVSALTGEGFELWLDKILHTDARDKPSYDIDYDVYARAEAALGWYNCFVTFDSPKKEDVNILLSSLLEAIRSECAEKRYEIAHLKAYTVTGLDHAKASVTSTDGTVNFAKKAEFPADRFNLILNARIESSPAELERICKTAITQLSADSGADLRDYKAECFSPSYPKPKYRLN